MAIFDKKFSFSREVAQQITTRFSFFSFMRFRFFFWWTEKKLRWDDSDTSRVPQTS